MLSFIVGIYRKYQEYVHPGIYVTRHGILYREKGCKYQVSPLHKLMVGKVWTGKIAYTSHRFGVNSERKF